MNLRQIGTIALLAFAATPFTAQTAAAPKVTNTAPQVASVATLGGAVTHRYTFKQLGAEGALALSGNSGPMGVNFGNRRDEVITSASVRINYIYSPAMIADLSHIQIRLNGQVLGLLPVPKEKAGQTLTQELPLDPRYFTDFNQLSFNLIGHYTSDCEDLAHSSLWAQISHQSTLELNVRRLVLTDDLSRLPEPFFDRRDTTSLVLPFVFASNPSAGTQRAAAVLASMFGVQAGWRGSRFPVNFDTLPTDRHAIVFATNEHRPAFMANWPTIEAPTVMITADPTDPSLKRLLVLGRNDEDLLLASQALAVGRAAMSGSRAVVKSAALNARSQPYDAPNWVRLDRPTKFGELIAAPSELQTQSNGFQTLRVNLRVPPDLFTWRSRGVPLDLKYRYTPPRKSNDSRLTIAINNDLVRAFPLKTLEHADNALRLSAPGSDLFSEQNDILVPAFKIGSRNQLQFNFSFVTDKEGRCTSAMGDGHRAAIDPDSTIDFSGFPHYAAMPNLGFFVSSGFPFTRYADLSDSAVVVPDHSTPQDLETLLTLMGRMGESTGYPALQVRVVQAAALSSAADADLLVIGSSPAQPLIRAWQDKVPSVLEATRRLASQPTQSYRAVYASGTYNTGDTRPQTSTQFDTNGGLAAFVGFESPLKEGRSVVMVIASDSATLPQALNALTDPEQIANISGSIAYVRANGIESTDVGHTYYIGELSWLNRIWFFLSAHPFWTSMLGVLAVITLAFAILRTLKGVAARRLRQEND